MEGSDLRASNGAQCEGTNARGERCGKRAVRGRFCLVHAGAQDMTALGHAGGKASVRSRLGLDPELADARLRRKAKQRLEALLDSEDEAKALTAARSLYSYSPARAPSDEDEPPAADSVKALTVILRRLTALPERELVELLDREAFNLVGRITQCDPELKRSYERFIERLAELSARKKVGAARDRRSPGASRLQQPQLDRPTPDSERVPYREVPAPPSAEEKRRAAELERAKADWAERGATAGPQH